MEKNFPQCTLIFTFKSVIVPKDGSMSNVTRFKYRSKLLKMTEWQVEMSTVFGVWICFRKIEVIFCSQTTTQQYVWSTTTTVKKSTLFHKLLLSFLSLLLDFAYANSERGKCVKIFILRITEFQKCFFSLLNLSYNLKIR